MQVATKEKIVYAKYLSQLIIYNVLKNNCINKVQFFIRLTSKMGCAQSAAYRKSQFADEDGTNAKFSSNNILIMQNGFSNNVSIPLEVQVAHFTPSSFPLLPIITQGTSKLCTDSWKKIVNNEISGEYGIKISGLTAFYNEFYERLDAYDSSGRFESILSRHSNATNRVSAKGAILINIVTFALGVQKDDKATQLRLYMLGK